MEAIRFALEIPRYLPATCHLGLSSNTVSESLIDLLLRCPVMVNSQVSPVHCVAASAFPNPQFERPLWQSLNGPWQFSFDDLDTGVRDRWYSRPESFPQTIRVPFCFESSASGIGDRGFHAVCWYRRVFHVPEEFKAGRVLLHFGAVDYRARVWINGNLAGAHEGGQTPFELDISDLLVLDEQTVTVRVEDPPTDRLILRGKQYWKEKSESIFYSRTSGIWQSVWVEAAGSSYIKSVRTQADCDGRLSFFAVIENAKPDVTFSASVSYKGIRVWHGEVNLDGSSATLSGIVDNARVWCPESPNLYDVTFELSCNSTVLDVVHSYLGFRTVEVRVEGFYLNHAQLELKFVLDQGYWPETLLTPPDDAAIVFDIEAVKACGFNGVRKHQKVEDPRFLYFADRAGLLVSGEIGNAPDFAPQAVQRLTAEWTEAVMRDWSHPCVVMWVPVNESWGVPNLGEPAQRGLLRAMYWLTKALDPTRPVIDNDGWEHTEFTDLFALHDYTPTGEELTAKYTEAHARGGFPEIAKPALVDGASYNGAPLYLSEFGGVAYAPSPIEVPGNAWGYYGVESEYGQALARICGLLRSAARLPGSAGFCYTQLTDVEQEINGILTYDRRWKFDPKDLRQAILDRAVSRSAVA